jgi:hypothetical protein
MSLAEPTTGAAGALAGKLGAGARWAGAPARIGGGAERRRVLRGERSMQVGDRPADFQLPSTEGAEWDLAGCLRRGHRAVLAFFPAAFTGG